MTEATPSTVASTVLLVHGAYELRAHGMVEREGDGCSALTERVVVVAGGLLGGSGRLGRLGGEEPVDVLLPATWLS